MRLLIQSLPMSLDQIFVWLDSHSRRKSVKLLNQVVPVVVCLILLIAFILGSLFFIQYLINPYSTEKIRIELYPVDVAVGFFLYFVTAIDYALIVGRMQVANPGSKARLMMNICTCIGCFLGVTLVLFLWGYAKEVPWLIIPILIFAGSIMIRLAHQGIEYFKDAPSIPQVIRVWLVKLLKLLHSLTSIFTFWIPELASPKVKKMSIMSLAKWSLFLPFIIGLDDLVGYMGAMTIYNVFSLLTGIYLADILIDVLIFISPSLTKKLVENAILSVIAALAFLFLAYKSYSEAGLLFFEHYASAISHLTGY
jgi:hypothetical protein